MCSRDFGVLGFGMNSMSAKLNAVSLSLAGAESADMIDQAYESSVFVLHKLYEPPPTGPKLCADPKCGFCWGDGRRFSSLTTAKPRSLM